MNEGSLQEEVNLVETVSLSIGFDDDRVERSGGESSRRRFDESDVIRWELPAVEGASGVALESPWYGLSRWSQSLSKRLFDCTCVILAMPVVLPLLLAVAVMVRLTSRGPILFLQQRVGRGGRMFKIVKFRTMVHLIDAKHHPVTTSTNQQFTPIGSFLRRLKLDELPQVVNVLLGDMSLVGPRPKLPEHVFFDLPCRPGITGPATIMFAREEIILADIPKDRLKEWYFSWVLPIKRQLDGEYMARATFISDLRIILNSVLRRWGNAALESAVSESMAAVRENEHSSKCLKSNGRVARPRMDSGAESMSILARVFEGDAAM